uniref:Uncharacterized protein n=1 Tax=Populus alba TaxID=43335 RepID=A0A4U5Q496_POPAL|nr:hypothetical protein D5086_0000137530 [Populus alba]
MSSGGGSSRTDQESGAASYCLRGPSSIESLNFPLMLPASVREDMSPKSIQKAASDAGMAIDAQMILNRVPENELETEFCEPAGGDHGGNWHGNNTGMGEWDISIEDYL